MGALDIFAWIVLVVLIASVVVGWIVLAMLPGRIARQRGHPQADAISVGGWVGAFALGIFWPLALIWAFTRPSGRTEQDIAQEISALKQRLAELESATVGKKGSTK